MPFRIRALKSFSGRGSVVVPDPGLEVLFRQGQRGGNRHAASREGNPLFRRLPAEHQVPVEQQQVVPQLLPGAVNAVDIVGLPVQGVFHKGELHRKSQRPAVGFQHVLPVPGGHHHLPDAQLRQQLQLPGDDGLPRGDLRHAFGVLLRQVPHPGSQPGIQNQGFQSEIRLSLISLSLISRTAASSAPRSPPGSP